MLSKTSAFDVAVVEVHACMRFGSPSRRMGYVEQIARVPTLPCLVSKWDDGSRSTDLMVSVVFADHVC